MQKLSSKKQDILVSYHETVFHSCQKCIKELHYCNNVIHSKVVADKFDEICSTEKKCTEDNFFCEVLTHDFFDFAKNFCYPFLKYFLWTLCSDLYYINRRAILSEKWAFQTYIYIYTIKPGSWPVWRWLYMQYSDLLLFLLLLWLDSLVKFWKY